LKEEIMTLNFLKARRARKEYYRALELELERHYRMMKLISEASKNGMK